MTTIIAFSDTHGYHDDVDLPDGDLLIHGGDLTGRGGLYEVEDFDDYLSIRDHPEKVVIAGNHDGCFQDEPDEARSRLTEATYLQDGGTTIEGLKIWGSPWTPRFFNWSFMLPRGEALAEKWAMIPEDVDILVTHGPPHGILDEAQGIESVGCRELRRRVEQIQPRLHIFGHIHEARGRVDQGGTTFVNASCFQGGEPFVIEM